MDCDDHSQNRLHSNASRQGYQDAQTIEGSVLTTNSYLEESGLTTDNNKNRGCVYKWKMERRRPV